MLHEGHPDTAGLTARTPGLLPELRSDSVCVDACPHAVAAGREYASGCMAVLPCRNVCAAVRAEGIRRMVAVFLTESCPMPEAFSGIVWETRAYPGLRGKALRQIPKKNTPERSCTTSGVRKGSIWFEALRRCADAGRKMKMKKKCLVLTVMSVLLGALYMLPVHMGNGANAHIPVIGAAEKMSEEYCEKTLVKATAAYASAKLVDKSISTLQRVELSIAPFGVGMTVAPGEMLAAVNDAIERVSAALFFVMGLMLVEKLLLGMISWVSFKVLLPVALVFAAYFFLSGRRESWTRAAAIFLANVALVCWLFFPLSALVSSYVENAYTGPVYEEQMARVNGSAAQMETMELEMNRELEQAAPAQEDEGWLSSVLGKAEGMFSSVTHAMRSVSVDKVKEKASRILNYADDATDRLFHAFCIFVLTTMIIPLSLFFLLSCLLRMFLRQLINSAPQAGSVLSSLAGKARQAGIEHKEVKEERPSGR